MTDKLSFEEIDIYIEIDIKIGNTLIGMAEVEPNKHQLERFKIFEPYQNKGYGQQALDLLIKKYMITSLWVRSNNARAIHIYNKFGFEKSNETMFEMIKENKE